MSYRKYPEPPPRFCYLCQAEIFESMGSCRSDDVLAFMEGKQNFIREACPMCATKRVIEQYLAEIAAEEGQ